MVNASAEDVSLLWSAGLLEHAEDTVYVEYGAGKGSFALMLAEATPARSFVLNDISTFRLKADRVMKQLDPPVTIVRCHANIKDFVLASVPDMLQPELEHAQDNSPTACVERSGANADAGADQVKQASTEASPQDDARADEAQDDARADEAQEPQDTRVIKPFVALGKHLCGAATDFTMRSAVSELRGMLHPDEAVVVLGLRLLFSCDDYALSNDIFWL